ncbi:MAG: hypothetical protein JST98_02450 [Bacteroidetes bacterium]|nr:hypothetical protein [Bacteroidota bacterium]
MKGVSMLYDEARHRRLIQIDLDELDIREEEAMEDLFDLIIAESRKDTDKISLEELQRLLKADGKL